MSTDIHSQNPAVSRLVDTLGAAPAATGGFDADRASFSAYWAKLDDLLWRTATADGADGETVDALRRIGCESRAAFLDRHVETVYRRLTDDYGKFVRVEHLVFDAAKLVPGLCPDAARLGAEHALKLSDKPGLELAQGIFLSKVAALPAAGTHLCHTMLLPHPDTPEALAKFQRDGRLDLGRARIERRGETAVVTRSLPDKLNCEDDSTYPAEEIAVDVATLDPAVKLGILRGDVVDHPKHAGRRLFSSGINLTGLYWGQVSYMFYIARDMGLVNKLLRGVARPDADPSEVGGGTTEKLWLAAVEGFAIGGGCQLLLVVDFVIAERGAYMNLPARKEGIIPGMANLRLPRFVGEKAARQGILNDRQFPCDSPEGRLICDEIVAPGEMDVAIDRMVDSLTGSGIVSAAGNRRAIRVGQEPLEMFRQYLAVYAREQAFCHLSPALVANLENYWSAHERKRG